MMRGERRAALGELVIVACLALSACTVVSFPAPPSPTPAPGSAVWHHGPWFTDSQGRVLLFHGVNMVDKQAPYYPAAEGFSSADISLLQSMGMNVVRLGVIFAGVMPEPGQVDQSYLSALAAQVGQLAQAGIYAILDFHQDEYGPSLVPSADGFPAWATQTNGAPDVDYGFPNNYLLNAAVNAAFDNFWANAPVPGGPGTQWGNGLQNYYQEALAAVAATFSSNTDVLGYEVMNEPWPGSAWPSCLSATGCPAFDDGPYLGFIQRAVTAIRSVDRDHLIFYEPNVLFNEGFPSDLGYVGDPGTVFAFHLYPICGADNGGNFPGQDQVCGPEEEQNFANAQAQEGRSNAGEFMTEFGDSSTNDDGINRQLDEADLAMVSWTFWSFDGHVVNDIGKPPTGANLNGNVVEDLSRPYPQAVAGVPISWTFDPSTRDFWLAYSTSPIWGGSFPPGTVTEISTPGMIYPSGYSVSVYGASVVSSPNAAVLELATNPGATTVYVQLTPAG
jgi:endoglycosylceramidase